MRVLLVCESYLPRIGGAERALHELARVLANAGDLVEIVTLADDPGKMAPGESWEDLFRVRRWRSSERGWKSLLMFPVVVTRLALIAQRFDVLNAHYSSHLAAATCLAGRMAGKPVVVTVQGRGTLDSSVSDSRTGRAYRAISLKLASAVVATSSELGEVAAEIRGRDDVFVIPNGVDLDKFTPVDRDWGLAQRTFCSVRRLVPKNGVRRALKVAVEVAKSRPQMQFAFLVIGEGSESEAVRRVAATAPENLEVKFLGSVGHSELPELIASSHYSFFLSSAEAVSLALLESMATGAVPIVTAVGGLDETIINGINGVKIGVLSTSSDYQVADDLSDSDLQRYVSDVLDVVDLSPERASGISTAATQTAGNYNWSTIGLRVREIFETCR